MTTDHDNLTPQEQLARIVREETDGGRSIVRFFRQVVEGERDSEGFQPNHKMDSAKELVKIGLTEFQDYIDANNSPTKRRKTRRPSPDLNDISPEILKAREELAQYARELTQDGRTVVEMYSEVMDGLRNDEGFKPHHRIAAGRELLLRGFGPVSSWTQPEPGSADSTITDHQPNQTNHNADHAPEPRPQPHPTIFLTPAVSEYLSEAIAAYEGPNPIREALPQEILDIIDSDEPPDDCPCLIAENEGRDIPCPENEECPYHGIEWPEFTDEESEQMRERSRRALRLCGEMMWGTLTPSEEDP